MALQNVTTSAGDKLQRTRYYMGGYWTFLATGAETNGQFSLIEVNLRKGLEPPRHTHTYEDESFHVIEGELMVIAGQEEYILKAGDFLNIPKGIAHNFTLRTDKVKMLIHMVPAGLEQMFLELSQPAVSIDFPPIPAGPPSPELLQKIALLQQKYGISGMENGHITSM